MRAKSVLVDSAAGDVPIVSATEFGGDVRIVCFFYVILFTLELCVAGYIGASEIRVFCDKL